MQTWKASVIVAAVLLCAIPSNAYPGDGGDIALRFKACYGRSSTPFSLDQRLGACNTAIESKEYTGEELDMLYFNRSTILNEKGEPEAARADAEQAIKAWPDIVGVLVQRADAYNGHDKYDLALADLEVADRASPNSYLVHFYLAKSRIGRHELDLARKEAASAVALRPDGANTLTLQAELEATAGNIDGALAALDRAIVLSPRSGIAYNMRCYIRALTARDLAEKALPDCNMALDLLPHSPNALDSRGLVYLRMGRYADAKADYTAGITQADHPSPPSLYGRGIAEQQLGNQMGATADFSAAETLSPGIGKKFNTLAMMAE